MRAVLAIEPAGHLHRLRASVRLIPAAGAIYVARR